MLFFQQDNVSFVFYLSLKISVALFLVEFRWPAAYLLFFRFFSCYIFQTCGHDTSSKLNTLENTDTETFPLSVFVFTDYLVIFASQDAGSDATSRQNNPRFAFGLPYLLIELFYIGMSVVLTDGRAVGRCTVTWLSIFFRMASLPHFFTHDAPLWARALL